jgi:Transglutaminase-like superfamily
MAQVQEMRGRGELSEELPKRSKVGERLTAARMLFRNPGALKKLIVMSPDELRYVRPPREYELPEYRKGMKYCKSNEKYLRPTWWCNPRKPLIVAMAHELGAYELSDWEFAEAAYWFVKTKLAAEMRPLDSASAVLKRGTGMCYGLTSLWLALCRAAGIKGRYQSFTMHLPDEVTSLQTMSEQGAMTVAFFDRGTPEAQGEVYVDGKWTVGHVAMRPEMLARLNLPIPRFGEDAARLVFKVVPGTIKRFESIPLRLGVPMNVGIRLIPAAMERATIAAQMRAMPPGRKIIDEAGGIEAYDQKARAMFRRTALAPSLEPNQAIVFEES